MDILDEFDDDEKPFDDSVAENEEIVEEIPEKSVKFDPDKVLEDDIHAILPPKMAKSSHMECSRCGNSLGSVDKWFDYGISEIKCGYSMLPRPLCKACFHEFEAFMSAFEVKT